MFTFSPEGGSIACIVPIRIKYRLVATFLQGLMTACMSPIVNIKLNDKHERNLVKVVLRVEIRRKHL